MAEGNDLQEWTELVDRIARRLQRELDLTCELGDLRAWGHQGVLEARARFDNSRGIKFSTFAFYRVRGAMLDGVRSQGFLPRRAYAKLKAFEATDAVGASLADAASKAPHTDLKTRAAELDDALGKITAAYIIAAVGQDATESRDDPTANIEREQTSVAVHGGMKLLPDKERTLVEAVYFEGVTIEEAGARLGLSKSWASRLHAKALERMRKSLSAYDA